MRPKLALGRSTVISVFCGAVFGFSLSYLLFVSNLVYPTWNQDMHTIGPVDAFKMHTQSFDPNFDPNFDLVFSADQPAYLKQIPLNHDGPTDPVDMHTEHESDVAAVPSENVRLLCWVMTQPKSHKTKARHVKATWGRRCNYLLFMSSEADYTLPAIRLKVREGRNALWAKTKEAFKYIYQHYMDKVDWVLKADDDTYVIVENLRYVLSAYNATDRVYMGCKFKPYVKQGYMSGGAGYVLSREAVNAFVEEALPNAMCRQDGEGAEDVEMGKCMELVGAKAVDSRDEFGRHRFFPLPPAYHLVPNGLPKTNWFWRYIYYQVNKGFECCSDTTISFHYISPNDMYVLEFLIYHVKPHGVTHSHIFDRTESDLTQTPKKVVSEIAVSSSEINDNNIT